MAWAMTDGIGLLISIPNITTLSILRLRGDTQFSSTIAWAPGNLLSNFLFLNRILHQGTNIMTRVSGFLEGQAAPQLAILAQISTIIRQGHYTKGLGVPKNLVHVGHSFGSFLSHALLADYPQLSDGAVLTGIGYNGTDFGELFQAFRLNIATSVSPGKWPGRNNGYLTWSDIFAGVSIFFHGDSYDEEAAWYGESIKQPLAAMEFLTLSTLNKSSNFTGPVLAISGEFDFPSCGGNCYGVLEHPLEDFFSNANPIETVVHPKVRISNL